VLSKKYLLVTFITVFICDVILLGIGSMGVGKIISHSPIIQNFLTVGGICFLAFYCYNCLGNIYKMKKDINFFGNNAEKTARKVVLKALAFSFLNPYAILDTLVIVGSVAARYEDKELIYFTLGAITASALWFSFLIAATYFFAKYMNNRLVWQFIEGFGACLSLYIIYKLFLFWF
jgi:L-lysine exporter family protein LysE/ArgO